MKREEEYIIGESLEVAEGERYDWLDYFYKAFPALRHKNFRIYFTGHLVSLIGTWLQTVAQGYLIYELTNSAYWVGAIAAAQTLPALFFTLFGGIIVDRYPKRKIITITQTVQMTLAFILAGLTFADVVSPAHIAILAVLLGISFAIDMPARQTFVNSIVDREDLVSAVSLNAGVYNAARIIGPAFAGILISLFGVAGAFFLNGLSFLAYIIGLYLMDVKEHIVHHDIHPLLAIQQGLHYAFNHQVIKPLLLIAAVTSATGWSYITVLPVLAKDIYGAGPEGLGYLQASAGMGAVLAAVTVSALSKKVRPAVFIMGGALLFIVSYFLLSFIHTLTGGIALLLCMGFGLLSVFSTVNATIQHNSEDSYRGRVMSIYTLMFVGLSPVGSLFIGYLTQHFGVLNAFRTSSLLMLAGIFILWIFYRRRITIDAH